MIWLALGYPEFLVEARWGLTWQRLLGKEIFCHILQQPHAYFLYCECKISQPVLVIRYDHVFSHNMKPTDRDILHILSPMATGTHRVDNRLLV